MRDEESGKTKTIYENPVQSHFPRSFRAVLSKSESFCKTSPNFTMKMRLTRFKLEASFLLEHNASTTMKSVDFHKSSSSFIYLFSFASPGVDYLSRRIHSISLSLSSFSLSYSRKYEISLIGINKRHRVGKGSGSLPFKRFRNLSSSNSFRIEQRR